MNDGRVINASYFNEDSEEKNLRPHSLKDYIGQSKVKRNLEIFIKAAILREDPLDHIIFYGPPGLGKTTLANILATEMNSNIRITSGPAIEKPGELASILTSLKDKEILFIDEIHRLSRTVEEILYSAMEDYCLDIVIGKGPESKSIRIDICKFTLVGATTRLGLLTAPLRDRFGIHFSMDYYNFEELKLILIRTSKILNLYLKDNAADEIAMRSRGTPRIANRLLKRVRDFAQIKNKGIIDLNITKEALDLLEVDKFGLDKVDNKIINCIVTNFNGGPVGIESLSHFISEDTNTIEDVYEPFLIKEGFLYRTSRGRVATDKAFKHLGLDKK